jgi:hypothetical protein
MHYEIRDKDYRESYEKYDHNFFFQDKYLDEYLDPLFLVPLTFFEW